MRKEIVFLVIFSLNLCAAHAFADEKRSLQLEKSYAIENEIVDWHWRISAEGQMYPYLQIQFDRIDFLNSSGDVISQLNYLPHSNIVTSENQNIVSFIEQMIDPSPAVGKSLYYHITDARGDELYSIPLNLGYDDPIPALYPANNGWGVLVDGSRGHIRVFNSRGDMQREIDLFDDDIVDLEKAIDCAINGDSDKFAVVAQKRPAVSDESSGKLISGEPWVMYFSLDGDEMWRKAIDLTNADKIHLSPSGNFIVVSHYTPGNEAPPTFRSTVLNDQGQEIIRIPALARQVQFSRDERWAFIVDRYELYRIDLLKRNFGKVRLIGKNEQRIIVSLLLSPPNGQPLIFTARSVFQHGRFEFVEPEMLRLNSKNELLWKMSFTNDSFITPSVFSQGERIGIGFIRNYKIYREGRD